MREANIIIHKLMCEKQHMHTRGSGTWKFKHGLVHHSSAAGPAAR
jgi:hypothetical protein